MASLLQSTCNTRALPTGSLRYIRSEAPLHPSEGDIRWLIDHRVTTLVDLRSPEEVLRSPCPLASDPAFCYHHLPVTGGGDPPKSREGLYVVYRQMVDGRMERILKTIQNAPEKGMYFCAAGKDRTGVVSALLLRRLGYDEDTIVADYMLSRENLMPLLLDYVREHPQVDLELLIPRPENILQVLENL